MLLTNLLTNLPRFQIIGPPDMLISALVYDSRQVQPGSLFVAVAGFHVDGHTYIPQALERGAVALVVDERYWTATDSAPPADHPYTLVIVPDSRVVLAPLAAAFYGHPAQHLRVVGVTGTKGKSTTTALVSQVLEGGGYQTGMISTVDFKVGTRQWANTTRQSTPEAPEVQAFLREMVTAGCSYAVIEATSHALSERWNRLGQCAFDVAVFLNVTHEHLDYHGSVEQYRRDKARLFAMLGDEQPTLPADQQSAAKSCKLAIVNADDPHHHMFLDAAPANAQRLTYAINAPADVRADAIAATTSGSRLHVTTPWGDGRIELQLPGNFNASNALAALSVALSQGVPLEQAAAALAQIRGIRGRMEQIQQGQPFGVIVDYAHNPDSFEQVLSMLRPLTVGKMIAVFGSAGERDREKRPVQGAIAGRYCELLVLTDEDPRREDREAIIAEIAVGVERAGKTRGSGYLTIPDRAEAIRTAFAHAQPGDLVLLLGKGHEGSIEYADGKHPWNESAEARAALCELGYCEQ